MTYFSQLPNLQVLNRTTNNTATDETVIVKNLFKRAKIREDIASISGAFEFYSITENERPDDVAEKIYGDPELDWVILLTNNILNLQDEWPLDLDSFNRYLEDKYESEDRYTEIHHYETITTKDSFGRIVFPGGLIVDEAFYNAPEFQTITENPPGITFPPIFVPGTQAVLTPIVGGVNNSISAILISEAGLGYDTKPTVTLSPPDPSSNASADSTISDFAVTSVTNLSGGEGYLTAPTVTFSDPIQSVQATVDSILGQGINIDKVDGLENLVGGIGYGLTAPSVTFEQSPVVLFGLYAAESSGTVGNDVEGFYVKSDGTELYTASFTGINQIKQYTLSTGWDVTSLSLTYELDVSADFNYTTGVEFKPDGTRMYVSGGAGVNYKIISYSLSTSWDLSTASKLNEITLATPGGLRFKDDGSRLFVLDFSDPDIINEYSLGTNWDISTINVTPVNTFNVTSPTGDNDILGFGFNSDGTKLFATSEGSSSIYEFDLDAWDISTASFVKSFFVGDRLSSPSDVFIRSDREKLIVSGGSIDKVFEYNLNATAKGTTQITNGSVTSVTVTQVGAGYTLPPTVTIGAPFTAVTATGIASITSGIVTSIDITNAGFGYTVAPTVTIESAPTSVAAIIEVSVANSGISSIRVVTNGSNYVTPPTVTVSAPDDVLSVEQNDLYTQNQTTWRWNGTSWQEKITEEFQYLDPTTSSIIKVPGNVLSKPITNFEFENRLNEDKRLLYILKPNYLPVVIDDLRNIMRYSVDDPNYITDKLKKTYNEKIARI